jgi:class 3 adenylate cyclase
VNVAQRLQTVAKAGQILITEQVYQKIKESFHCEINGEFTLKNKEKAVITYLVID